MNFNHRSIDLRVSHLRAGGVFYGGDQVSGLIDLIGPINLTDGMVEITLSGISKTMYLVGDREVKEKADFFHHT